MYPGILETVYDSELFLEVKMKQNKQARREELHLVINNKLVAF